VRTLLFAAAVSLLVSLVGTKLLINGLTRRKIGQPIREDGPQGHTTKAGTPTMGGAAIVAGAVIGYLASDLSNSRIITRSGLLVMLAVVGSGAVGLVDDWIKVTRERNLGLTSRTKFLGLFVVAAGFAVLAVIHTPVSTDLSFTRAGSIGIDLGQVGWCVWAVLLIVGTTNAVNLTDGLDGLAGGSAAVAFTAFIVIGFWGFRHGLDYGVPHALDLAVIAACMTGACIGLAGHRRGSGRAGPDEQHPAVAGHRRWPVRHGDGFGDRPGGHLPALRASGPAHGADPSPLRARGVARDHRHHPVLDPLGRLHGRGHRAVLRRLPGDGRGRLMSPTALVVGLGVTGRAVATALVRRGTTVAAVEDRPAAEHRTFAADLAIDLLESPDDARLADVLRTTDVLLPSPGVPDRHPVFALAAARGVAVRSEFDLAAEWDDRPIAAVTGTNGKTTVTHLVTDILRRSGLAAAEAGNVETPLVEAIDDPTAEVFVVEASSFRLGHTAHWRPAAAAWLNFAPDHLDVHADLQAYEAAKARIWADQEPSDLAVANADDPVVARHRGAARRQTFGLDTAADATVRDGRLVIDDEPLLAIADLRRSLRHDQANALAAALLARGLGADRAATVEALVAFDSLPHRVELVGERDGIAWYDDSKATTPHATRAALASFPSVVLIAGGRNKGLDLSGLLGVGDNIRAVVAIGEAADDIAAAVGRSAPVEAAASMSDAVALAAAHARPGDAVLLSPGCASFDWYSSYGDRGDDFSRIVRAHLDREAAPS
jgi:UDP-N-acetylmuramoylalanine--D-glutamate ligase